VARIAVPVFDNQTFPLRREVEIELTRAFREEIQSRTNLILTTEDDADMVVYGTVSDYEERVIAEGPRDEKIESSIVIEAVLLVEDYRNQRRWKERVRVAEPLSVDIGQSLQSAQLRAVGNLANRLLEVIEWWDSAGEPVGEGAVSP
jgi:hypothetical protein